MLNWFKKKKEQDPEPEFDPTNVRLYDLKKGAFVDYDFKTWQVLACYEYDWGDDFFSDEFQLNADDEIYFLHIEEDGVLHCTLQKKIAIRTIEGDVTNYIIKNDNAPSEVTFQGVKFYKQKDAPGYFRNTDSESWVEMILWTYYDETETFTLSIKQWGNEEFEAASGIVVSEYKFSNIIIP